MKGYRCSLPCVRLVTYARCTSHEFNTSLIRYFALSSNFTDANGLMRCLYDGLALGDTKLGLIIYNLYLPLSIHSLQVELQKRIHRRE